MPVDKSRLQKELADVTRDKASGVTGKDQDIEREREREGIENQASAL